MVPPRGTADGKKGAGRRCRRKARRVPMNDRPSSRGGFARGALAASVLALAALGTGQAKAASPDWSTGHTRAFAIQYFWFAMANQPDDCPNGFSFAMSK